MENTYEFDVWKVGEEAFATFVYHNRPYGIHLTSNDNDGSARLCGIEINDLTKKMKTDDDYARMWIFVFIRHVLEDKDMPSEEIENAVCVARGKQFSVNSIWEYDYNAADVDPLVLYITQ